MGLALSIAQREASLGTEGALIDRASIEAFLREVEARAYRIALVHMRDRDEALDIVQDSMIRLVQRYSGRPSEEWPPLFYRILQNRIRDWGRRRKVSRRILSFFGGQDGEDDDPIVAMPGPRGDDPAQAVADQDALVALERALRELSEKQREAFVLRTFECLDVAETAVAMGVSDGSVKTHYSRAVSRLRELLGEHWS